MLLMILEVLIDERVDGNDSGIDSQLLGHEGEKCFSHAHLFVLEGKVDEFVEEDIVGP